MESDSSPNWNAFREQMPVTRNWAYFDHAAVAPLCQPAVEAMREWIDDIATHGDAHWSRWRDHVEKIRNVCAHLLNADEDEIAFIRNTTEGINIVAEGFPWKPRDNIVLPAGEFPTNLYPWLNLEDRGVKTRMVPVENERLDLNQLESTCDERTRLIALSWVGYATGWRNDLEAVAEIAHRKGALLFVDAIQGLGVFPLDVSQVPVDFLAADGHKWLLGPEGAGVFFMRKEHLHMLRPVGVGWNSVVNAGDFSQTELRLKPTASRYEGGSHAMPGLLGFGAAVRMILRYGVSAISKRLVEVTDTLCERLPDLNAEIISCRNQDRKSGIVSFTIPKVKAPTIRSVCREHNVIVNCRAGRVRLSPHCYTNEDDVNQLMFALKTALQETE
ncbi:MAG: aminotransferase class V-fold PLP-dependent enzyme [Planctomycetaceae bacterium]